MTAQVSQTLSGSVITPTALTPAATDTVLATYFGRLGLLIRVMTAGTATDVAVLDPGRTPSGNLGTVVAKTMPATGAREWIIPRDAIDTATGYATITFSGARTNVTYELKAYG